MAKLYQRLNPQVDIGQRMPETVGEELLITVITLKWMLRLIVDQKVG